MIRGGTLVVALLLSAACVSCSDEDALPLGRSCANDGDCASGFCYAAVCLEAAGDPDEDGLTSAEERALGTHPIDPDSDDDGLDDREEVGELAAPRDTDADGRLDALENQTADADGDCVPDPQDPADGDPTRPGDEVLKALFCRSTGVCATHAERRRVRCENGVARCDYRAIDGFELDERSCDGVDNDCDGRTDEGITVDGQPVGGPCPARGACGPGVVECDRSRRVAVCSTRAEGSADQTSPERCNRKDDDCDGETDEDIVTADGVPVGAACNGRGTCGVGVVECDYAAERALCSTEPGGSQAEATEERCDGLDNDCDGETDEDLAAPAEGCRTAGVCGAAGALVRRRCDEGQWRCDYEDVAGYEEGEERSCDGQDNDCDGPVDEPFAVVDFDRLPRQVGEGCGTGACAGGIVECAPDGRSARCSSAERQSAEQCNGQDDDCDGRTDEDQLYDGKAIGQICEGEGQCGEGVVECAAELPVATCSTNPDGSTPGDSPEVCDGHDNDCDAATDEELAADAACEAPGVCATAEVWPRCLGGEWVCDYDETPGYEAGVEARCDGLDNNCDGLIDEAFPMPFGEQWTVGIAPTPPARSAAAWALLPDPERLILFGGRLAGAAAEVAPLLADLWSGPIGEDGSPWQEITTGGDGEGGPEQPRARDGALLVADPARGRLLLVGGRLRGEAGAPVYSPALWALSTYDWRWSRVETTDPPEGRAGHDGVLDETSRLLWIYGGDTPAGGGSLHALALDTGTWWSPAPQPPTSSGATAVLDAVENTLVVFGGRDPDGTLLDRTLLISLPTGPGGGMLAWTRLSGSPAPAPRTEHAALLDSARRRLIIHGGVAEAGEPLGDTWAFDLERREWAPLPADEAADVRVAGGRFLAMADGSGLLVGGRGPGGAPNRAVRRFEPATDTWAPAHVPAGPPPLSDAAVALDPAGRRLLVAGGRRPLAGHRELSDETWSYALDTGSWSRVAAAHEAAPGGPGARAEAVALYDAGSGRFVLHGGVTRSVGAAGEIPSDGLWELDADDPAEWRPAPGGADAPALAGHSAVVDPASRRAYVFGGRTPDGPSALLRTYDLSDGTWATIAPVSSPPPALYGHAAVWDPIAQQMLVVGGTGGGGQILRFVPATAEWSVVAIVADFAATNPVAWLDPLSGELLAGSWRQGADAPSFLRLVDGEVTPAGLLAPLPSSVRAGGFVLDPVRRRAIVLGGFGALPVARDGLWVLDQVCP